MCGRFTLTASAEAIEAEFRVAIKDDFLPRYNIAPSQEVLAIARDRTTGEDRAGWLRWGLVPHWAKDPSIGNRMINARAESLSTKPAFRSAYRKHRCLIVADGFYEWAQVPGEKRKQPYWIHRTDDRLLAFAGLWERWGQGEEEIASCTVVTTEPVELVRPIHDRMPLVLSPEDRDRWLDPEADPAELGAIARRPNGEALEARPVSTAVNRPANDDAECIEPLAAPE
jgi:putative SOS response-associated peptidase YedK